MNAALTLLTVAAIRSFSVDSASPAGDSDARGALGPVAAPAFPSYTAELFPAESSTTRPRAIEHSDFYYVRLGIHRYASYAIVPTFIAEYALGQSLFNHPPGSSGTRTAHSVVAVGLVGLFGINTVTGVWNLWDSRHDGPGRARRWIHAALMITSDAGFVATEAVAPGRRQAVLDPSRRRLHRTLALSSMGLALGGYGMMLVWK